MTVGLVSDSKDTSAAITGSGKTPMAYLCTAAEFCTPQTTSSPPAAGFNEVLYPGEIEYRTEQRRQQEGIFVEDEAWGRITDIMSELGVLEKVGQP